MDRRFFHEDRECVLLGRNLAGNHIYPFQNVEKSRSFHITVCLFYFRCWRN